MPAATVSVGERAGDGAREERDGVEEADDASGDCLALGKLGLQLDEEDAEAEGDHSHGTPLFTVKLTQLFCSVQYSTAFWLPTPSPPPTTDVMCDFSLKVTPSAIMFTRKEAATTTQPHPPSGATKEYSVLSSLDEDEDDDDPRVGSIQYKDYLQLQ